MRFFLRSEHLRQSDKIDRWSALSNVKSPRVSSSLAYEGSLSARSCRNRKFRLAIDVPTRRTRECRVNRRARTRPFEQLTFLSVNIHVRLDSSAGIQGNLILPSSPLAVSMLDYDAKYLFLRFTLTGLYSLVFLRNVHFWEKRARDIYWHFRPLLSRLRQNNIWNIWRLKVTMCDMIDNSRLLPRKISFQVISSNWSLPSLSVRTRIDGKFAAVDTTIEYNQVRYQSVRALPIKSNRIQLSRAEPSRAEPRRPALQGCRSLNPWPTVVACAT